MARLTNDPMSVLNSIDDPALLNPFPSHGSLLDAGGVGTIGSDRPLVSFMHDCRPPPITDLQRALRFYDDNYEIVGNYFLRPNKKVVLGGKGQCRCRFCGKTTPEVTFKNIAHAVPESLGNKTLFSLHECDDCNTLFGTGIENDFGNWSKPMPTLARVKGKSGIPTIRQIRGEPWRIEAASGSELQISSYEDNPAVTTDEDMRQVTLLLHRDDYTPVAVLKALVKMGLTIFPEEEMVNFQQALGWIREKDHSKGFAPLEPVVHTFVPGPLPNDVIVLIAVRRKCDSLKVPYASFILCYANEVIQIFLPSPKRDSLLAGGPVSVFWFPRPSDAAPGKHGQAETSILSLTDTSVVKGDVLTVTMSFESVTRRRDA
jgi:HNH endonuclease